MLGTDVKQQLAERFREVNGDHPMTDADDAYVSAPASVTGGRTTRPSTAGTA
ncbi:hypothetical protein [Streptomyces brasiliensis]|uniref:Uncharacterized protein n=1 Tax=Streptomyces brasiliensis TaxID=1954 RepID=A0A917P5Q6_9ACTN|nr:hypothetical protein [Streptomyces brasiliensis]GGJ63047.1 hypothetical protein GCM10010121_087170 [Streptomyces brasiliensis]